MKTFDLSVHFAGISDYHAFPWGEISGGADHLITRDEVIYSVTPDESSEGYQSLMDALEATGELRYAIIDLAEADGLDLFIDQTEDGDVIIREMELNNARWFQILMEGETETQSRLTTSVTMEWLKAHGLSVYEVKLDFSTLEVDPRQPVKIIALADESMGIAKQWEQQAHDAYGDFILERMGGCEWVIPGDGLLFNTDGSINSFTELQPDYRERMKVGDVVAMPVIGNEGPFTWVALTADILTRVRTDSSTFYRDLPEFNFFYKEVVED